MTRSRYPGYDVLDKRNTPSWDAITRKVIEKRLATPIEPRFIDPTAWHVLQALCDCIVPQPAGRERVPIAGMLDARLHANAGDGYRDVRLPPFRQAWRVGLAALNEESEVAFERPFFALNHHQQQVLLKKMQRGELNLPAWQGMPSNLFFSNRILKDLCSAYYSHPYTWSDIGFGGPANPRGYVRMYFDRRDAWEAAEVTSRQDADNDHVG